METARLLASTVTREEHGRINVGEGAGKVTEGEAECFLALAESKRRQLNNVPVLTREGDALKAHQVVGVLAIPGKTLEILPKVDGSEGEVRDALVQMIAVAHDLNVADGELAGLTTQRQDLLEIVIGLFVQRLSIAVRRGLPCRYIRHEDDLWFLRGRLKVVRQFTQLAARPDLLACRYDELSEDTPLNRVLKAAVKRVAGVTKDVANARRLAELAARFEFVGESAYPLGELVQLDRTNTAFHDLHELALLLLSANWQTTTGGKAMGFTLLFQMNVLFEKFIGNSLLRTLGSGRVGLGKRSGYALRDAAAHELFNLRPDVVIDASGACPIVLDTKWKELKPLKPEQEASNLKVDRDDVYQMLAYAGACKAKRLILLYPWHRALGLGIARWSAQGPDGERIPFDIATVDVGSPKTVRAALRTIVDELG